MASKVKLLVCAKEGEKVGRVVWLSSDQHCVLTERHFSFGTWHQVDLFW